jgi:hypothetical protein
MISDLIDVFVFLLVCLLSIISNNLKSLLLVASTFGIVLLLMRIRITSTSADMALTLRMWKACFSIRRP